MARDTLLLLIWACLPSVNLAIDCEVNPIADSNQTHENVTTILNVLLDNYDKMLRPGYNSGLPTPVNVDINIRSMGPISEKDMTYKMDAYFRQTWEDRRLKFKGPHEKLAVSVKTLEKMWIPDTYFYNGLGSYLHTITTPNKLLRIYKDGKILYSMRLTIKASCPMYLHYFPVDQQSCPLHFGSYAYTQDQLVYKWRFGNEGSISTAKGMRLSQFDLVATPAQTLIVRNHSGALTSGEYSTLKVNFVMNRHMGYFLIQVYVPCSLIVVLSWVAFWINREATADRVSLGILTELTLTTLSMDTRDDLPKVPYLTALDWFVILCYVFVTATILEYAGVHYFTKIGSGEVTHDSDSESDDGGDENSANDLDEPDVDNRMTNGAGQGLFYGTSNSRYNDQSPPPSYTSSMVIHRANTNNTTSQIVRSTNGRKKYPNENLFFKFLKCVQGSAKYRKLITKRANRSGVNTVSRIDKISRILFPVSFTLLSVIYWIAFSRYVEIDILQLATKKDITTGSH